MRVAVYLPLLAAVVLGSCAPWLARRLPPPTATRLLTLAAVVSGTAAAFSLGVLAFLLVAHVPPAAELGHWSAAVLRAEDPVPPVASVAAAVACVVVLSMYLVAVCRQVRAGLDARALCSRIGGEPGRLVVLDSDRPDAFALSADRGRIVVTRPLLRELGADERRALLAHERAHLDRRHHRYRVAVAMAAAICPLLRPVREAVTHATERWADEQAAAETGDRRLVATTLARTSLLVGSRPRSAPAAALRVAAGSVVQRVQALLVPECRQRPLLVVAVLALVAVSVLASLDTRADAEHLLEVAFAAWSATG